MKQWNWEEYEERKVGAQAEIRAVGVFKPIGIHAMIWTDFFMGFFWLLPSATLTVSSLLCSSCSPNWRG
jgi:hypothetical protein